MSKKNNFEVGLKLLSIYHLALFVHAIPYALLPFAYESNDVRNEALYLLLNLLLPLTYLFTGIILVRYSSKITHLFFREDISDKGNNCNEPSSRFLSYGIILIGIFYLIKTVSNIIAKGINLSVTYPDPFFWSEIISQGTILTLSIVLIIKNRFVLNLIKSKTDIDI